MGAQFCTPADVVAALGSVQSSTGIQTFSDIQITTAIELATIRMRTVLDGPYNVGLITSLTPEDNPTSIRRPTALRAALQLFGQTNVNPDSTALPALTSELLDWNRLIANASLFDDAGAKIDGSTQINVSTPNQPDAVESLYSPDRNPRQGTTNFETPRRTQDGR